MAERGQWYQVPCLMNPVVSKCHQPSPAQGPQAKGQGKDHPKKHWAPSWAQAPRPAPLFGFIFSLTLRKIS